MRCWCWLKVTFTIAPYLHQNIVIHTPIAAVTRITYARATGASVNTLKCTRFSVGQAILDNILWELKYKSVQYFIYF